MHHLSIPIYLGNVPWRWRKEAKVWVLEKYCAAKIKSFFYNCWGFAKILTEGGYRGDFINPWFWRSSWEVNKNSHWNCYVLEYSAYGWQWHKIWVNFYPSYRNAIKFGGLGRSHSILWSYIWLLWDKNLFKTYDTRQNVNVLLIWWNFSFEYRKFKEFSRLSKTFQFRIGVQNFF